jgi:hypothetical protein
MCESMGNIEVDVAMLTSFIDSRHYQFGLGYQDSCIKQGTTGDFELDVTSSQRALRFTQSQWSQRYSRSSFMSFASYDASSSSYHFPSSPRTPSRHMNNSVQIIEIFVNAVLYSKFVALPWWCARRNHNHRSSLYKTLNRTEAPQVRRRPFSQLRVSLPLL